MSATNYSLVCVHGNGGGAFRFERMRPHLPEGVAFLPVTLPGFAERAADPALATLADYAKYLSGWVGLCPAPVVVLGHGIGGSIVLEMLQSFAPAAVILHAPVGAQLDRRWFPRLMSPH